MPEISQQIEELYQARDAEIVARIVAGETMAAVARDYGLTRARVSQIAHSGGIEPRRWSRLRYREPGKR
jgi:hypothetical protein